MNAGWSIEPCRLAVTRRVFDAVDINEVTLTALWTRSGSSPLESNSLG
jgi:hypothetical protein